MDSEEPESPDLCEANWSVQEPFWLQVLFDGYASKLISSAPGLVIHCTFGPP